MAEETKESSISVEDSLGRIVRIPVAPQRIVALSLPITEAIKILGAIDRVVGTSNYTKLRVGSIPELANIESVGRGFVPNLETLAKLNPQLVITWSDNPGPELEGQLAALDIAVLRLDINSPLRLEKEMGILAEVLGGDAPLRAKNFLLWNKEKFDILDARIRAANRKKPTVLVEYFYTNKIAGVESEVYETIVMAGGDNLGKFITRYNAEIDGEWIIKTDPDFIIKLAMFINYEDMQKKESVRQALLDSVLKRPGWEDMRAIKNHNVYVLDEDLSGGTRNIIGVYQVAHWLYPDLVTERDVQDTEREYLVKFLNAK
ncbi:MAG: ABC transporter substrate-binding protein [Deltaproteobacteria bacterium]|nr:ABC transporter substrate-binding protein [Deltaproteobacteria bacterium]